MYSTTGCVVLLCEKILNITEYKILRSTKYLPGLVSGLSVRERQTDWVRSQRGNATKYSLLEMRWDTHNMYVQHRVGFRDCLEPPGPLTTECACRQQHTCHTAQHSGVRLYFLPVFFILRSVRRKGCIICVCAPGMILLQSLCVVCSPGCELHVIDTTAFSIVTMQVAGNIQQ